MISILSTETVDVPSSQSELDIAQKISSDVLDSDNSSASPSRSKPPKKRVNFASELTNTDSDSSPSRFPNSKLVGKSILKKRLEVPIRESLSTRNPIAFELNAYPSFTDLLMTMCDALKSQDPSTKVDIYRTLTSALRGFRSYPDSNAVHQNLPLLITYIKNDIENPIDKVPGCDSRIMIHAIRLITQIASLESLASAIEPNDGSWLLERAISTCEDPSTKKGVLSCYLSFLAFQRFPSSRVFTFSMAIRVLSLADSLRLRSRTVEGCCYLILENLILSNSNMMLSRAAEWIPICLRAAFDSNKIVHSKAIAALGTATRMYFGRHELSKVVHDSFETIEKSDDVSADAGKTLFELCYGQIDNLLEQGFGDHVAVLWETVIILMSSWGPGRDQRLDAWWNFSDWFKVLRRCLCSSNASNVIRAINSWQKFAYFWVNRSLMSTNSEQNDNRRNFLIYVFRCTKNKNLEISDALISAFYKLCYLSLRQGGGPPGLAVNEAKFAQNEFFWKTVIDSAILENYVKGHTEFAIGTKLVYEILSATKTTNDRRKSDLCFATIQAAELPALDSRWLRANIKTVLRSFGRILSEVQTPNEFNSFMLCWDAYLGHLRTVIRREVRLSAESTLCIHYICNFLLHYLPDSKKSKISFERLTISCMDTFGLQTFLTKAIVLQEKELELPEILSPRTSTISLKAKTKSQPPVIHLLCHLLDAWTSDSSEDLRTSFNTIVRKSMKLLSSQSGTSASLFVASVFDVISDYTSSSKEVAAEEWFHTVWQSTANDVLNYLEDEGHMTLASSSPNSVTSDNNSYDSNCQRILFKLCSFNLK
ncbi:Rap1-interacting factor 1 N terminal-domain-containing protein [Lipomyces oligophaga]|uniref:Rap1-interacting factor 1 N terminal-domain-containing protein n=1 Tax=Lipomyces oligophaga TaxID=45792 RepID=UPI0034CEF365